LADTLTWKALCALDAILEQAKVSPFAGPNVALRFVLAYVGWRGADPRTCRDFWVAAHGLGYRHPNAHAHEIIRRGALSTAMHGICRSLGHEYTVSVEIELKRARMTKVEREADRAAEAAYERRKRGECDSGKTDLGN
jgi:hypothetical protein